MAKAITLARKTRKNMEVPAYKERQKTKKAIAEGVGAGSWDTWHTCSTIADVTFSMT